MLVVTAAFMTSEESWPLVRRKIKTEIEIERIIDKEAKKNGMLGSEEIEWRERMS